MGLIDAAENDAMKCSIKSCAGEYQSTTVLHTVRSGDRVVVIDHVPAEVCAVCGDVLFTPQTVRHIERLLADLPRPTQTIPLFEYA
jgi:YgiT-type zinc finger domain-containing protein